jgi:hypothetical protein
VATNGTTYSRRMDLGLVWTIVGSVAGILAVLIGALQLRSQPIKLTANPKIIAPSIRGPKLATASVLRPPFGRLPSSFRDRQDLVKKIQKIVTHPDGRIHVLHGLGGIGKTAASLKIAQGMSGKGRTVWWISASTGSEIIASMMEISNSIGASENEIKEALTGRSDPSDLLWSYLGRYTKWLLILDNVDDIRILDTAGKDAGSGNGWLRPSRSGAILITSRLGDPAQWGSLATLHAVNKLDSHNSALVLRDIAPGAGTYEEAKTLAEQLGCLPLALHHAGAFLASPWSTHRSFSKYFEATPEEFPPMKQGGTLATTWESSLDMLKDQGVKQARPLLRILSCFAGAVPIPKWFLSTDILSRVSDGDQESVLKGLDVLRNIGLIDVSYGGVADIYVTVHPLVAEANRLYLSEGEESVLVVSAVVELIVNVTEILDNENPADLPRWLELLPHVVSSIGCLSTYLTDEELGRLAGSSSFMASSLVYAGYYDAALQVIRISYASATRLGDANDDFLKLRHEFAATLSFTGKIGEAEKEYQSVAEARRRLLGPSHPQTLHTLYEVVRVIAQQGRLSEALELGQTVWETRRSVLGPCSIPALKTGQLVANILLLKGEADRCIHICESLLSAECGDLDESDPVFLSIRNLRAKAFLHVGSVEEACAELSLVLASRRAILRTDHPAILNTRFHLTEALLKMGKINEARKELRALLSAGKANLPLGHPLLERVAERLSALDRE